MNKVEILSHSSEGSTFNTPNKQPSLMLDGISSPQKSQIRKRMPIRTKKKTQTPKIQPTEDIIAKPNNPLKTTLGPAQVFSNNNNPFTFEKTEIHKEDLFDSQNEEKSIEKKSKY